MEPTDISHSQEIYTVSRLNREARLLLEGNFPSLWIEGELSNFVAAQSGHWYFSLKDATSQIRCAMFKPQNRRLAFIPKDGMQVILKGRISLYEGRGDFQLLADHMEDAGEGKLRKAYEALKQRLADAGLFDTNHKKSLPTIPTCIGVITSPTGAAIRDILHVLKRRFASIPVIIYPALVQGESAAATIIAAIQTANQRQECDVLILARGGGSLEDLWPFNEESVAHAIYRSDIPIISGVGHEIDFTIADFVADVRAPTPSAAAELVTPDSTELLRSLQRSKNQLVHRIKQMIQQRQQQLAFEIKHLNQQHPQRRLTEQAQRLDQASMQLYRLQLKQFADRQATINTLRAQLTGLTPKYLIENHRQRLDFYQQRITTHITTALHQQQHALASMASQLDALSPLATLKRGFSIVTDAKQKIVLHSVKQTEIGNQLNVQLSDGSLDCNVITVSQKTNTTS